MVKNVKNLKFSGTKLKSGKTYYIAVRAYVTDSTGKKVFGKSANTKIVIK